MESTDVMKEALKAFVLEEFLHGEDPGQLADSTPLITGGIVDSMATIKLVSFIEERYKIALQPDEMDVTHLNTIASIVRLLQAKLQRAARQ